MPAFNNEGIEVYCPKCERLFSSEKEMLEHYDAEHEGTKEPDVKNEEVGEKIAGIISVAEMSFLRGESFYLILTSSKILGAKIKPPISSSLSPFLGRIPSVLMLERDRVKTNERVNRLARSLEKDIINDDPKNFVVPYSEIARVELKKHGKVKTGEIHLVTHDQKHLDFRLIMLPWVKDELFNSYSILLRSTLQEKLCIIE